MFIGNTEIRTPADYPWAYDPSWRHEMSKAMASSCELVPETYYRDRHIQRQRMYLSKANGANFERYISTILASGVSHPMRGVVLANRLYGSTGHGTNKDRVEALLLCPELTYEHIGKYFDLRYDDVETYQHLFFNCRDDEGKLRLPHGLMQYFATRNAPASQSAADYATNWRMYAFQGGSRLLFLEWKWPYDAAHVANFTEVELWSDLLPKVYQRVEERLRFDVGLDGRALADLANLVRQALADLRKEGIVSKDAGLDEDSALMQVMALLKPMVMAPSASMVARKQTQLDAKLGMLGKKDSADTTGNTSMDNITRQLGKQE